MNQLAFSDLTVTAQRLLELIANDQLEGKLRHDLGDLAEHHRGPFPNIHAEIQELTSANIVRMERLGCVDGAGLVRFHVNGDLSAFLQELNGAAVDVD